MSRAPMEVPALNTPEVDRRFRTMADHAPVLLWMARTDALCEFFNRGWLEFTGRSLEQEYGEGWAEGVHPEDLQACMQTYLEAFGARRQFAMEYRLRRHDGEYRWVYDQGAPHFEADGTFAGYIGSCIDVTDQRRAQDALKMLNEGLAEQVRERTAIARERETLLREVHHRVKNDLQLISSILSMQARRLSDRESVAALEECQGRVQAVAWAHEQMYRADSVARMDLSSNIRTLVGEVFRVAAPGGSIGLEIDADDGITLSVERAIPCGLIVNELVTNALKHAFPDGRGGMVRVTLHNRAEGRVELAVADDGIGLSEERQQAGGRSLGWYLIQALAEQLEADLIVSRDAGTRVSVTFRVES